MARLYEINNDLLDVIERASQYEEETGEISTELFEEINALNIERNEKLEAVACYLKNIKSDVDEFKREEETLAKRRKILENKAKRLEKYLSDNFDVSEKLETPRVKLSYRRSSSVSILDESIIPRKYFRVKKIEEVDKTAIKTAIKEGRKVKGADLVETYSLQIK